MADPLATLRGELVAHLEVLRGEQADHLARAQQAQGAAFAVEALLVRVDQLIAEAAIEADAPAISDEPAEGGLVSDVPAPAARASRRRR